MAKNHPNFHFTANPTASLFDIWAEGSLRGSIKPAWEYLCKTIQTRYPTEMRHILRYSDEIYYILLFLVEEYNLRKKSATITESFYELTRQCSAPDHSFRFRHAKLLSLLSVIVLPYLVEKLEKQYKKVKEELVLNPNASSCMWKRQFVVIYTKLCSLVKWVKMANYMCYVFGYTGYGNPILYLTRMQIKYGTNIPEANGSIPDERLHMRFVNGLSTLLSSVVAKMVPFLLHSLQFADMFYNKDMLSSVVSTLMSVDTPPAMPKVVSADVKLSSSDKQCPLCRQPHRNPTTVSMSGFVFCYTCIFQYVQMYKCCPITYRPCGVTDLVNLRL